MKSVLTKFSKGIKNSAALSFGLSASDLCDDSCRQKSGDCYALGPESQYKDYGKKLRNHMRAAPHNLVYRALNEIMTKRKSPDWFRLSVSGSIPARSSFTLPSWKKFTKSVVELCDYLTQSGCKIHIPVETMGKARSWRTVLSGTDIVVRRSIQSDRLKDVINSKDHTSWVCGEKNKGLPEALKSAETLRIKNKTVVICPAIVGDSKCGKCTACAEPLVDVVLYPKHR